MSLDPLPPTPIPAMFNFSLGDLLAPSVIPPATQNPIPARPVCWMNWRRLLRRLMNVLPLLWKYPKSYRAEGDGLAKVSLKRRSAGCNNFLGKDARFSSG